MKKKIILVGTSHTIQNNLNNFNFRNYIKKLAIKNRVKIIAEEMKTKDDTVGKIISIKLKIKHLIIEPTDDEKIKLNIKKVGYIQWCFMSKYEMEYLNIKDLDDSKLNEYKREVEKTYRQREKEWFRRIKKVDKYPILIICGACHVKPFYKLLKSKSLFVNIKNKRWGVYGKIECLK
ncbi:MAG: hypothetical protein WCR78_12710 [Arcobacteraceae bacterium]